MYGGLCEPCECSLELETRNTNEAFVNSDSESSDQQYCDTSSVFVIQPLDHNKLSEPSKTETLYIKSMMMDTPSGNTNNGINLYEDGGNNILIRNIQNSSQPSEAAFLTQPESHSINLHDEDEIDRDAKRCLNWVAGIYRD